MEPKSLRRRDSSVQAVSAPEALESLPVPALLESRGRVEDANVALLELLGLSREDVVGQRLSSLFVMPTSDWPAELESGALPVRTQSTLRARRHLHLRPIAESVFEPTRGMRALSVTDGYDVERMISEFQEALIEATGRFPACQSEDQILSIAIEAIRSLDCFGAVYRLEDCGMMASLVEDCESQPVRDFLRNNFTSRNGRPSFPLEQFPLVDSLYKSRRALWYSSVEKVLPLASQWESHPVFEDFADTTVAIAPIFLGHRPYGHLAVRAPLLPTTLVGALELFVGSLGSAILNLRHEQSSRAHQEFVEVLQSQRLQRERLAALGEAAAAVAHEVRNPLGAIINSVALLRRNDTETNRTDVLDVVEEESVRIEQLVKDLIDLARPMHPKPHRVNIATMATATVEKMRTQASTSKVVLEVETEARENLELLADSVLLQLALENLIRNAVQHTPDGSRVGVTASRQPDFFSLCVEDSGGGVAAGEGERIFEPFYTCRASGMGLGLALVRRVVEAHGGVVHVGKASIGGARFEIRLPTRQYVAAE